MSPRVFPGVLLAASLLLCAALPSTAAGSPGAYALRDGVVVDSANGVAYLMHPRGGIEALDLRRGTVRWRTTEGERPLAIQGDLLIAQAQPGEQGELRIVALDLRHHGARQAEADLPLPAGVRAEVGESLQRFFQVSAAPSPQGIVVSWESESRPTLPHRSLERVGDKAGDEKIAASRTGWGGVAGNALFEPQAGRLLPIAAESARQLAGERKALAATLPAAGGAERLFASFDGRYVLASLRVASGFRVNPYRWTISEAETGKVLGRVESRVSMAPFTVIANQVISVAQPFQRRNGATWTAQPLRLQAVDLTSGREVWTREIRDTEYRGPVPN